MGETDLREWEGWELGTEVSPPACKTEGSVNTDWALPLAGGCGKDWVSSSQCLFNVSVSKGHTTIPSASFGMDLLGTELGAAFLYLFILLGVQWYVSPHPPCMVRKPHASDLRSKWGCL